MIKSIVAFVNFYFPSNKSKYYPDNFIKACLVYQYLYIKYFTQRLDLDQIIYRQKSNQTYFIDNHANY